MYRLRRSLAVALLTVTFVRPQPAQAQGNAVTHWNSVATTAVLINPGRILDSRALAAVHAAIHDAVNAIDR